MGRNNRTVTWVPCILRHLVGGMFSIIIIIIGWLVLLCINPFWVI